MKDKQCGIWTLTAAEVGGFHLKSSNGFGGRDEIVFFGNHIKDALHDLKHLVDRAIETWEQP